MKHLLVQIGKQPSLHDFLERGTPPNIISYIHQTRYSSPLTSFHHQTLIRFLADSLSCYSNRCIHGCHGNVYSALCSRNKINNLSTERMLIEILKWPASDNQIHLLRNNNRIPHEKEARSKPRLLMPHSSRLRVQLSYNSDNLGSCIKTYDLDYRLSNWRTM